MKRVTKFGISQGRVKKMRVGGGLPSDRATNFASQTRETGMTAAQRADTARNWAKSIAATAIPFSHIGKPVKIASTGLAALDAIRTGGVSGGGGGGAPIMGGGYSGGFSGAGSSSASGGRKKPTVTVEEIPEGKRAGGKVKGGSASRRADGMAHKGKTKGKMVKMASGGAVGGSYRKQADGIAMKGKTRGKMIKMAYGGKC